MAPAHRRRARSSIVAVSSCHFRAISFSASTANVDHVAAIVSIPNRPAFDRLVLTRALTDEAALLSAQVILSVDPLEELVDERREHGFPFLEASRWRQLAPCLIEVVQLAHTQEGSGSVSELRSVLKL